MKLSTRYRGHANVCANPLTYTLQLASSSWIALRSLLPTGMLSIVATHQRHVIPLATKFELQTIPLALRSDHAVAKKRRNTSTLLAKAPFEKHFKAAGQSVEARQADTDTYRQCLTSRGGDCNCHRPSLPRPAPLATVLWSLHRWLQKKRSRVKALALSSSNMQQPQYACCAAAESVKRAASATPHCCGELWSGR